MRHNSIHRGLFLASRIGRDKGDRRRLGTQGLPKWSLMFTGAVWQEGLVP